jgi:hypothetical protein
MALERIKNCEGVSALAKAVLVEVSPARISNLLTRFFVPTRSLFPGWVSLPTPSVS